MKWTRLGVLQGLALLCAVGLALPVYPDELAAQTLLAHHARLEPRLLHNQFMRPVVLDSQEQDDIVAGDIFVVSSYPFAVVSSSLNNPDHWCEVMSLHINTKYCRAVVTPTASLLKVYIGKKTPQQLKDATRLEFAYNTVASSPTYFSVQLTSPRGMLGTRDYQISFEAVPLPAGGTFMHLRYSLSMSLLARMAIRTYLATIGSGKVGFTTVGTGRNAEPQYIGGVRALVERNTMRYYLALDSYLATLDVAPSTQLGQRLQSWFSAVEQYPQLHELDRDQYMSMKHAEYLRQQSAD
jgi:hypothetical protein